MELTSVVVETALTKIKKKQDQRVSKPRPTLEHHNLDIVGLCFF